MPAGKLVEVTRSPRFSLGGAVRTFSGQGAGTRCWAATGHDLSCPTRDSRGHPSGASVEWKRTNSTCCVSTPLWGRSKAGVPSHIGRKPTRGRGPWGPSAARSPTVSRVLCYSAGRQGRRWLRLGGQSLHPTTVWVSLPRHRGRTRVARRPIGSPVGSEGVCG